MAENHPSSPQPLIPPLPRRNFISLGIGAIAASALPVGLIKRHKVVRRQVPVMGTIADLVAVHSKEAAGYAALEAAVTELRWVESRMTRFDRESDIGRANMGALTAPVEIHPATAMVLREGLRWAEQTDGKFDPALGRLTELWDVTHRTHPPSDADVADVKQINPYRSIDISSSRNSPTVRFASDVAIDLGGIAKGYAVDRAADALRRHRINSGMVNVGGDLYAIGSSPDGDPWQVGIRNPFSPDEITETIPVTDGAIATSGDYLRFFEHGGKSYHHLIDAKTGAPREAEVRSVTVAADNCISADAWATAQFGLGADDTVLATGSTSTALIVFSYGLSRTVTPQALIV